MTTLVTKEVDILHHAQASLKESHSCPSAAFRLRTVFVVFEDHRPNASQYHILVWRRPRHRQRYDRASNRAWKWSRKIRALRMHLSSHSHQFQSTQRAWELALLIESPGRSCERSTNPRHVAGAWGRLYCFWSSMTVACPHGRCHPKEYAPIVGVIKRPVTQPRFISLSLLYDGAPTSSHCQPTRHWRNWEV